MRSEYNRYLKPEVVSRLANLELKAKFVVEGFIAGLHKSPYHGFSVEFAQHRQYMPGDDIKFLDWKILGRTDRYYIKQYEEETNLKSYLIFDTSKSMSFNSADASQEQSRLKKLFKKNETASPDKSDSQLSKIEYAKYLAASLAVLMHFQKDATGLVVYDESIKNYVRPKSTNQNLKLLLNTLSNAETSGKTNTASVLNEVADKLKRRGLVIVFSDLFDDQKKVINALKHFRHYGNEVIVFHILDPQEMNMFIDSPVIFKDLETNKELLTQPLNLMEAYKEAVQSFIETYKRECRAAGIDYVLLSTETPFDKGLIEYLNKRKKLL